MKKTSQTSIDYRINDLRTAASSETVELHVLARAYHAAWQAVHDDAPEGIHPLPMLHASFEFPLAESKVHLIGAVGQANGAQGEARAEGISKIEEGRTRDHMKQHDDAIKMFALLRDRLLERREPIRGYSIAAQAIGLTADHSVHVGQVNSRIDLAAFNAGYPMIATHMVRKPNGKIHPLAFGGPWEELKEECLNVAESHRWTPAQLDDVLRTLEELPERSALSQWNEILDREIREPGFIRERLHRRLNAVGPQHGNRDQAVKSLR